MQWNSGGALSMNIDRRLWHSSSDTFPPTSCLRWLPSVPGPLPLPPGLVRGNLGRRGDCLNYVLLLLAGILRGRTGLTGSPSHHFSGNSPLRPPSPSPTGTAGPRPHGSACKRGPAPVLSQDRGQLCPWLNCLLESYPRWLQEPHPIRLLPLPRLWEEPLEARSGRP